MKTSFRRQFVTSLVELRRAPSTFPLPTAWLDFTHKKVMQLGKHLDAQSAFRSEKNFFHKINHCFSFLRSSSHFPGNDSLPLVIFFLWPLSSLRLGYVPRYKEWQYFRKKGKFSSHFVIFFLAASFENLESQFHGKSEREVKEKTKIVCLKNVRRRLTGSIIWTWNGFLSLLSRPLDRVKKWGGIVGRSKINLGQLSAQALGNQNDNYGMHPSWYHVDMWPCWLKIWINFSPLFPCVTSQKAA